MKINIPHGQIRQTLYAPHISEKSTLMMQDHNQYAFMVAKDATKKQVQKAVEKYYDVKVSSVNLMNVKGKPKGKGRNEGHRRNVKKAYVTLVEGNTISMSSE